MTARPGKSYRGHMINTQPHDHIATYPEAMKEYAANAGSDRPEQAWILTPWDVWEPNPAYHGPAVMHPEMDEYADQPPCCTYHDAGGRDFECGDAVPTNFECPPPVSDGDPEGIPF